MIFRMHSTAIIDYKTDLIWFWSNIGRLSCTNGFNTYIQMYALTTWQEWCVFRFSSFILFIYLFVVYVDFNICIDLLCGIIVVPAPISMTLSPLYSTLIRTLTRIRWKFYDRVISFSISPPVIVVINVCVLTSSSLSSSWSSTLSSYSSASSLLLNVLRVLFSDFYVRTPLLSTHSVVNAYLILSYIGELHIDSILFLLHLISHCLFYSWLQKEKNEKNRMEFIKKKNKK